MSLLLDNVYTLHDQPAAAAVLADIRIGGRGGTMAAPFLPGTASLVEELDSA